MKLTTDTAPGGSVRHVPSLELLTDTVFAAIRGYLSESLGSVDGNGRPCDLLNPVPMGGGVGSY